MEEKTTLQLPSLTGEQALQLLGPKDVHISILEEVFNVRIAIRDEQCIINTTEASIIEPLQEVLHILCQQVSKGLPLFEQNVRYVCRRVMNHQSVSFEEMDMKIVGRTLNGKAIVPKTDGQLAFIKAIEEKPVVFGIGPAGTGKTFLAVIYAVSALKRGDVKRIVLTRPAVEAGENLGFLPGDLKEKVDPYLTPLYDALYDMLGNEQTEKLIEKGVIEIAPLAYMRGRTLNDAFVLLDEAQNTTASQMKMFLTRLGFRSHMIITGDVSQIDLQKNVQSGLVQSAHILEGLEDIAIIRLTSEDVVRNPIVQKIIERYSAFEEALQHKKKF
mgnify:FL=1